MSGKLKKSKQTKKVTSIQKLSACLTAGTLQSILSSPKEKFLRIVLILSKVALVLEPLTGARKQM